MQVDSQALDRSKGALYGLAIGDALGMPSQTLSRAEIAQRYGQITDFVAPYAGHPVSHGLNAAQVTDDTEQSLLLARRLLLDPQGFDELGWARDLMDWEADIRARGLRDLLGPSSKAALNALLEGASPEVTGRQGTTNGAAMRVAPVGISAPPEPALIVRRVAMTCRVTHNTGEAIASASAVAMVVSAGVAGLSFNEAVPLALEAATLGQREGNQIGERDMPGRIRLALEAAQSAQSLAEAVGTSVQSRESVAAAFGLLRLADGDGWTAMVLAANIGDDTDTIGAIAGAMAGACQGASALPGRAIERIEAANTLDIPALATRLLALRHAARSVA